MSTNSIPFQKVGAGAEREALYSDFSTKLFLVYATVSSGKRFVFEAVAFTAPILTLKMIDGDKISLEERQKITLNFNLNDGVYFIQCPLVLIRDRQYAVDMSGDIYKIQRRENYRSPFPDYLKGEAVFISGLGSTPRAEAFKLADLSVTGCAVSLPIDLGMGLEKGMKLKLRLALLDREPIILSAEVRYFKNEGEKLRVGCLFSSVNSEQAQFLNAVLLEIHRVAFSKFRSMSRT